MPKRNPDERSTILALFEQSTRLFKEGRALLGKIDKLEREWDKATDETAYEFDLVNVVDFEDGPRLLKPAFRQAQTLIQRAQRTLDQLSELEARREHLAAQAKQLHAQIAQTWPRLWEFISKWEYGGYGVDSKGDFLHGPLHESEWHTLANSDEDAPDVESQLAHFAGVRSISN
jgi:hypothetical protein